MKISARALLNNLDTDSIWDVLTGEFTLVMDDGEINTNWRETIDSFYHWRIHREYPKTPLLKRHHISSLLENGKLYGVKEQLKLASAINIDVMEAYADVKTPEFLDGLCRVTYEIVGDSYSDMQLHIEESVDTVDALDFVQLVTDPRIVKLKEEVVVNDASMKHLVAQLQETNNAIRNLIMSDKTFDNNPLAIGCRNGVLKTDQVIQCVGMRGPVTDIDSTAFPIPIIRGFADGFLDFYDTFIESRSPAKALRVSQDDIQNTEYFSRRLQFQAGQLQNLHYGDCGSTQYLEVVVTRARMKHLSGKIYLDDTTKMLREFPHDQESRNGLIGKAIKIRSVIHCMHEDPNGICATCFGKLSNSVPILTNLGHYCATAIAQQSSQMVLSTKHLDGNLDVIKFELNAEAGDFVIVDYENQLIRLNPKYKNRKLSIHVEKECVTGLLGMDELRPTNELPRSFFSDIRKIFIKFYEGKGEDASEYYTEVSIDDKRQKSHFTYAIVDYIRFKTGIVFDAFGHLSVDLDEWDFSQPIIYLPLRNFNPADHSKDIADMLEAKVVEMEARDGEVSPDDFLIELLDLVNSKLNINLAVLEAVVYGIMIRSAAKHEYSLPKPWTERGIGVKKLTMDNRSIAPRLAYQEHEQCFLNPLSYTLTNRPDHPLDGIVCPKEVFHHYGVKR